MTIIFILFACLALSIDSFAISLIAGSQHHKIFRPKVLLIPLSFSIFHMVLSTFGWLLGNYLHHIINRYDHWLAFFLLVFIGSKMLFTAVKPKPKFKITNLFKKIKPEKISDFHNLIPVSLATSLDAFSLGLSFSLLKTNISLFLLPLFAVIFLISLIGLLIGHFLKHRLEKNAQIFGGITLIIIGFKILFDHLF